MTENLETTMEVVTFWAMMSVYGVMALVAILLLIAAVKR